jgi:hypothetical protein
MSGDLNEPDGIDEGILDEMDEVRSKLGDGIDRLNEDIKNVFDWQAYVRSAPLTSVGIAAAVGYLLAPAIRSYPAPQTGDAHQSSSSGGIFGMLTSMVSATLVRLATGYVTTMVTDQLNPSGDEGVPTHPPVSPPDQTLDLGL